MAIHDARVAGPAIRSTSHRWVEAMSVDTEPLIRHLLGVDRGRSREPDERVVLERVPETAREVTGARYAALGILNERRDGLEGFLTAGVDGATHRAIGRLPCGRGVLGTLVTNAQPLRLADVAEHAFSYGFPPGHPAMHTFLGVPVVIGEQVWGNLYLTEKNGGRVHRCRRAVRRDPRGMGCDRPRSHQERWSGHDQESPAPHRGLGRAHKAL